MARCLLHIGAPKTGTTFLQQLCWDNRSALRDAGILYPQAGARRGGHHDFAFLIHGGYPDWATPQPRSLAQLEADLAAELAGAREDDVLLSSEDFYMFAHPPEVRALLERTGALRARTPQIVLYVRRQDDAHESWYNQTVKALGYAHTVDESLATFRELWDYEANLALWSAVFGQAAITLRVYETQQLTGGTLEADFLHLLGVDASRFAIPAQRINTGLNYDLLELQRIINRLPLSVLEKRRFHKQLIELSLKTQGTGLFDERPVLDHVRASAIMESYADGNARVARRYLHRDRLFLEESAARDRGDEAPRSAITPEKLAYFLGWVLSRDA